MHQEDRDHFQRCLASLPNATTSSSASSTNNSSNWGTLNADTVTNVALEMAGVGAATASLSLSNDSPSTSGMLAHCRSNSFTARFRRRSSRTRRRDDDDSSQLLDDEDSNDSPPLTESETDRLSNIDPRHDCIAGLDADVHMSDNSLSECPSDTKRPVRTDSFEPLLVSATWTMMPKITRQSIPTEAKEWTLFCFARRWPVNDFSPNSILIDHFSMRLHPNGSIIGIDLSGMPDLYLPYFGKELIGRNWNELICATDVHKWNDHVAKLEPNLDALTSEVYKVRPAVNTKFYVQTKSKRVGEGDEGFIMCYHLVIRSKEYGERLHRGLLDSSNDCMITHDRHTPTALTVNENHNYRNNMCSPTVSRGATTAPVFGGSFNCNGPQGLGSANDHSNSQQMLEPLPSSSNLGPESSSSNRLFEDFSPNAQSNPTDYNLNECLALNDMFPSSNWPDYDTSTNSMDVSQPKSNHVHTSNTTSETSSSTVDEAGKGNEKAQKLRNLLTQRSEPGSPSDEARKEMFDSQLAELTSNRNTLSSSAGDTHSPASRRNGSPTGSTNQPEKSRSNDILRELLHQEDDEDVLFAKTSHSDAVQRNFTCDPLASVESNNDSNMSVGASTAGTSSLNQSTVNPSQINSMAVSINSSNTGSSMCAAQLQPSSSSSSSLSCSSTSSTAAVSKSNGNNMLRKLLNDDDNGKAFRKGQDILIEQLFKENQSPVSSNNSLIESSSKSVGQMKRKSTEDHFSGQTIEAPANVSGSTIGSLLINSPVHSATTSETYQPIKRLSLSEPVKSSVPSPVQVRSTGPVMGPLSTMNVNSTTIPGSFRNVSTTTTVAATAMSTMNALSNMNAQQLPQQPQQLAGQNPMLAQMLAQTPKTLPLPPISIPTSIVSQVPQERLPKNLEKKLIHTPTTTTSPHAMSISLSASSAGCTMPNSTPSSLSFSMNGTIVSSSNHSHVPPSPLIQSTPIVVSSQLGSPNVGTYGGPPGGHMSSMSGHPQQFMMTTSGQFQPVKSIIVQTTAHPAGVEMGSQTQGNNFINKMYITHTQPQSSVPKSGSVQISSSSAGIASSSSGPMMMLTSGNTNAQMIMSSGHSSMVTGGAGPPSTTTTPAYFAKQSNSIGSGTVANHIAPSFIQNRVVASNTQRLATMDDINDPLLSDILEGVCCMEQEMNIDLLPGESTTTTGK